MVRSGADSGCVLQDGATIKVKRGAKGGRIHGHQHITKISGRVDFVRSDMDLEAGYAGDCAVRSTNFCRIIGEGGYLVAVQGRGVSEQGSRQLHSIARISTKPNYNILGVNYFMLHRLKLGI